jgi:integrase
MSRGLERAQHAWEDDTVRRREEASAEFGEWLGRLPPGLWTDWGSVTPELVVAYLEGYWVPKHATREVLPGMWGPAAGTLDGHISHLRSAFKLYGRVCAWGTNAPASCNPCDSEAVIRYAAGYRRQYASAGHEAVAARPFSDAKLTKLLERLDNRLGEERGAVARVLLARDMAMISFMHECGKRGKDCGQLKWRDLLDPSGQPLDPRTWQPRGGDRVSAKMFSKTHKVRREVAFEFEYPEGPAARPTSFLWRLEQYVRLREAAALPWGDGWLFSPQGRNKVSLANGPMSSSALGQRVRSHLEATGLDAGETPHSLRRGRTQALTDAGVPVEGVMQAMGMASRRTYDLYNDRTRPTRTRG